MNVRRQIQMILLTTLLLIGASQHSKAELILQFSADNSVNGTSVFVGQSFLVDIYLVETSTSNLSNGLLGFGFRGTFDSSRLQATGGTTDPVFNFTGSPNANISFPGQVDMFGGASVPPQAAVIHLGQLNFLALSPGSSVILFGDLDSNFDDFTLNDAPSFTSLDSAIFGAGGVGTFGFNVSITAVPEPSSLVTILLTLSLPLIARSRKRIVLSGFSKQG